ncbi:HNH endonuclease [Brevibacterium sediminis]|uniref:HNH endonuclease n=1 Tax=Brevibacterium sediminis TaxID=1857024 RepID=A0A5C4X6G0_9MICO|nr:HNH endonuclease signature motif containing protein [Brevibacterium sediminis]TNM58160.1 HNH endonuclease [Brevibacterium sediminis]
MPAIIVIIVVIVLIGLIIQFWPLALAIAVIWAAAVIVPKIVRNVRKNRYFAGEEFQAHKQALASFIAEHNAVSAYTSEIRNNGSFDLGVSTTGRHAHLATFENTSQHNYRRDRNIANYQADHVHNCSLQVVRNASSDPIKYLMKYFEVTVNEESLADAERLGNDIARLESAIENLHLRESSIQRSINPPDFILKYFADEFNAQVGVKLSPVTVPYPVYIFEYVSAGGNSAQRTKITLNSETVDALIERLDERLKYKKSVAGQRALMTAKIRSFVKNRDNYMCQYCSVSLAAEPHLLLEVDHIIPVSRGGLSVIENLQTLCWRCNRSKSNKIAS